MKYVPGVVVETIDNPDNPDDQLVLVEAEVEGTLYQKWYHTSEIFHKNPNKET